MNEHVDHRPAGSQGRDTKHTEADLLPLSALQHLLFCERQCALIHLEGAWAENRLTVEGHLLHERVHDISDELRGDLRVIRGMRLHSLSLGLYGVADVVEFRRTEGRGVSLPKVEGRWVPVPVEYKRGRPKPEDCDRVQLCAQAMCLEEMLQISITEGCIFYGQPRRRETVTLNDALRELVSHTAARLHHLVDTGKTPPPTFGRQCRSCSLVDLCLPKSIKPGRTVRGYLDKALS